MASGHDDSSEPKGDPAPHAPDAPDDAATPQPNCMTFGDGQSCIMADVDDLLRRFVAKESCEVFLRSLPLFTTEDGQARSSAHTVDHLDALLHTLIPEGTNCRAALDTVPFFANSLPFPFPVRCEAASLAQGFPVQFLVSSSFCVARQIGRRFHFLHCSTTAAAIHKLRENDGY